MKTAIKEQSTARRKILLSMSSVAIFEAFSPKALASDWPTRAITLIVPFAAGGGSDIIARIIAPPLGEVLKVPVIVQNRAGAGGNIGIAAAARSAPDGYSFLVASSAFLINPSLYAKVPYDPVKDFLPLVNVGIAPDVMTVPENSRFKNFSDVIEYAKENPGKLNWTSPGAGTAPFLVTENVNTHLKLKMVHVPFSGAGPATMAAIAGQVDLYTANIGSVLGQIKAGKLRALAQTGAVRYPELPNVPRLEELGLPGVLSENNQSLYSPSGVPQEITKRLATETQAILRRPDVRNQIIESGLSVVNEGPSEFQARVTRELAAYKEVIEKIGIKL
ncbi:MAG: tripartite tricarboxylate transporter substrate binding protein [Pseudomonadota bacterium]